jgi:hypothetical protein
MGLGRTAELRRGGEFLGNSSHSYTFSDLCNLQASSKEGSFRKGSRRRTPPVRAAQDHCRSEQIISSWASSGAPKQQHAQQAASHSPTLNSSFCLTPTHFQLISNQKKSLKAEASAAPCRMCLDESIAIYY